MVKVRYEPEKGLFQEPGEGFALDGSISYYHAIERVVSTTTDVTITSEAFILVDATSGDITVTLPDSQQGRVVSIKKIDSSANSVTLQPAGSETIDGSATATISIQWTSVTLQAHDSNWYIR